MRWWERFCVTMPGRRLMEALMSIVRRLDAVLFNQRKIMADLTKLQAATARIELAIASLPAPQPDQQAEIDAVTARIEIGAATLETRVTPTVTPTPVP